MRCPNCGENEGGETETLEHFLMECPHYDQFRNSWMSSMSAHIGRDGWEDARARGRDGINLALGAGGENGDLTRATEKFLVAAWARRGRGVGGRRGVFSDHNYARSSNQ